MLELVIVVSIISLASSVAVPRFYGILAEQRLEAAARRVVADLNFARLYARRTGINITVRFSVALDQYDIVGMPILEGAYTDYKLRLMEPPYEASIDSTDFGGDLDIIYDLFGFPDSGGSVVLRVGSRTRTVTVEGVTGKVTKL